MKYERPYSQREFFQKSKSQWNQNVDFQKKNRDRQCYVSGEIHWSWSNLVVFEKNDQKIPMIWKYFCKFSYISGYFRKFPEISGNFRKFPEISAISEKWKFPEIPGNLCELGNSYMMVL